MHAADGSDMTCDLGQLARWAGECVSKLEQRHPRIFSEPFRAQFMELLDALEASEAMGALYRERAGPIEASEVKRYRRKWTGMGRPAGLKVLDKEWRERAERFTRETAAPFQQEFSQWFEKFIVQAMTLSINYLIDIIRIYNKYSYPYPVDQPTWQAEVVEGLCSCLKRSLRDLFEWLTQTWQELAAWDARIQKWCADSAERAEIWNDDRKNHKHILFDGEGPEDRLRDELVADWGLGAFDVISLDQAGLARLVREIKKRDQSATPLATSSTPTAALPSPVPLARLALADQTGERHAEDPAPPSRPPVIPGKPTEKPKSEKKEKHFRRGELDAKACEILFYCGMGMTNDEIAERLGCNVKSLSSPKLVRFHKLREQQKANKEDYKRSSREYQIRSGRQDFEDG